MDESSASSNPLFPLPISVVLVRGKVCPMRYMGKVRLGRGVQQLDLGVHQLNLDAIWIGKVHALNVILSQKKKKKGQQHKWIRSTLGE